MMVLTTAKALFSGALVSVVAGVGGGSSDPVHASALRLELRTAKATFVRFEPVVIEYKILGPSSRSVRATVNMDPDAGYITFSVKDPVGVAVPYSHGHRDYIEVENIYPPGTSFVREVAMLWNSETSSLAFPKAGRYEVTARMFVGSHPDPVYIEAKSIIVDVVEPTGKEADAIDFFESRDRFLGLMKNGVTEYCQDLSGPACFEELSRFLRLHGDSAYAPQITWSIGAGIAHGFLDVSPKSDLAIDLYRGFLRNWPEHPQAYAVMHGLVGLLVEAGRTSEAQSMLTELETTYPERTDAIRNARERLRLRTSDRE